jgi:hypothetical protein
MKSKLIYGILLCFLSGERILANSKPIEKRSLPILHLLNDRPPPAENLNEGIQILNLGGLGPKIKPQHLWNGFSDVPLVHPLSEDHVPHIGTETHLPHQENPENNATEEAETTPPFVLPEPIITPDVPKPAPVEVPAINLNLTELSDDTSDEAPAPAPPAPAPEPAVPAPAPAEPANPSPPPSKENNSREQRRRRRRERRRGRDRSGTLVEHDLSSTDDAEAPAPEPAAPLPQEPVKEQPNENAPQVQPGRNSMPSQRQTDSGDGPATEQASTDSSDNNSGEGVADVVNSVAQSVSTIAAQARQMPSTTGTAENPNNPIVAQSSSSSSNNEEDASDSFGAVSGDVRLNAGIKGGPSISGLGEASTGNNAGNRSPDGSNSTKGSPSDGNGNATSIVLGVVGALAVVFSAVGIFVWQKRRTMTVPKSPTNPSVEYDREVSNAELATPMSAVTDPWDRYLNNLSRHNSANNTESILATPITDGGRSVLFSMRKSLGFLMSPMGYGKAAALARHKNQAHEIARRENFSILSDSTTDNPWKDIGLNNRPNSDPVFESKNNSIYSSSTMADFESPEVILKNSNTPTPRISLNSDVDLEEFVHNTLKQLNSPDAGQDPQSS